MCEFRFFVHPWSVLYVLHPFYRGVHSDLRVEGESAHCQGVSGLQLSNGTHVAVELHVVSYELLRLQHTHQLLLDGIEVGKLSYCVEFVSVSVAYVAFDNLMDYRVVEIQVLLVFR